MTQGHGPAPDAEEQLATARKWLAALDLPHAAVHVAQAIAADPALAAAYVELDRMPTVDLFPLGDGAYIGNVAACAHLDARGGRWERAFALIALCLQSEPHKPWTAAPWWPQPATVRPHVLAVALADAAPTLREMTDKSALHPFVVLIRALIDTEPGDIELAVRLSTVASALGATAEGASWCEHAAELTPGPLGWTLLGHALCDAQRFDEAITAWTRAADHDPGNAEIRVVLAKTLIERDRPLEGQYWLDAALAADPGHVAARMLTQVLDYRRTRAIAPLIAAVDDAVASDQPQLALDVLALGCDQRRWLHLIPMPTETVVSVINQIATRRAQGSTVTVTQAAMAAIEPPSAVAAAMSYLSGLRVQVLSCPAPDLRIPLREGTHQVWTYGRGTTPHPAVDRPPAAAVEVLRTVGDLPWRSPVDAFARSAGLASLTLADLLGLLGHMPPHPDNARWNKAITNPGYWPRLAAGWICLGILHHQASEAWADSARRRVLVDLAFGIEDWAADSAVFALIVAAWMDPSVRSDVHSLVLERFMAARKTDYRRVCTIAPSLAALVLITPGVSAKEARLARNLLARSAKPPKTRWAYVLRRVGAVLGR